MENITRDELKALIREVVDEALQDFFGDPDDRLEVSGEIVQDLLEAKAQKEAGILKTVPGDRVHKQFELLS